MSAAFRKWETERHMRGHWKRVEQEREGGSKAGFTTWPETGTKRMPIPMKKQIVEEQYNLKKVNINIIIIYKILIFFICFSFFYI